jgi:hypothetical protein
MARGLTAACLALFLQQTPSLRLDNGRNLFLLENWRGVATFPANRWNEVFTVSVDSPNVPALLGKYRVENGALVFAPQFPLQPGLSYRAVAKIPGASAVSAVFSIPKVDAKPTTSVERVYPTTNVLPENQLKFYIHFSSPMARGFAYDHVALIDQSGAKVDVPFLELGEELWDPSGRRFTLFFDPGRIKRGLLSQQELGIALHEGKRYTLVIDKGWKDAEGRPLVADFRKAFTVGPADRKVIDLKSWSLAKPVAGTRNALSISFPESMDHAILRRELEVVTAAGTAVGGTVAIGPNERSWLFTPDAVWNRGSYRIRVGNSVADLAGNMIDRPFEVDVFERVDPDVRNGNRPTRSIEFRID